MIKSYYASNPASTSPTHPFSQIGTITRHHCTGTQYEDVYSDDHKNDLPLLLDNPMFSVGYQYEPTVTAFNKECRLHADFRYGDGMHWLIPIDKTKLPTGNNMQYFSEEEIKNLILSKL